LLEAHLRKEDRPMCDGSSELPNMTAGLDLGDRYSYLCLIDTENGQVMEEGRLRTTPEAIRRRFRAAHAHSHGGGYPLTLGQQGLEECGHEVLVANARKLRLIYANKRKTDEIDVENLARLARLDPKLLYPLQHRGENAQAHMAIIRSRQALVGCRTQLVNPGYEERSNPSGLACPNVLPGASTRRGPQSTSPTRCWRPSSPSWSRDRLADRAHPPIREATGDDL
jgi:hypothetical protein